MKTHIKRILKKINRPVDIVWSFDLGNLYPFKYFPQTSKKIFHPVDEPLNKTAVNAAQGSDIIFAVTREITEKYRHLPVPKFVINHGISEDFLNATADYKRGETIKVGFSGNLTRNDIDRDCLKEIITINSAVYFHLWGTYEIKDSNISGSNDEETRQFILFLQSQRNIVLHGVVNPVDLAKAFAEMDAFLICYDVQKDQSKGTNYHKVMEYISTGRVIVSNNITAYANEPGLIKMIKERDSNKTLPALFSEVINNLQEYNSPDLQEKRIAFARNNTYKKQIERIEEKLADLK